MRRANRLAAAHFALGEGRWWWWLRRDKEQGRDFLKEERRGTEGRACVRGGRGGSRALLHARSRSSSAGRGPT